DEVAAPAEPERLQRLQLAVDGAVPTGDTLAAHAVPGDDPLSLQQELGQRTPIPVSREEAPGQRPAALGRGHDGGTRAGEAARATFRLRDAVPAASAERLPRVVRHLACPDQIPEPRECLL